MGFLYTLHVNLDLHMRSIPYANRESVIYIYLCFVFLRDDENQNEREKRLRNNSRRKQELGGGDSSVERSPRLSINRITDRFKINPMMIEIIAYLLTSQDTSM